MNEIFNDLLTILDEMQSQVERGETELDGISANNIAYIRGVVEAGSRSLMEGNRNVEHSITH